MLDNPDFIKHLLLEQSADAFLFKRFPLLSVSGISMEPLLKQGDRVFIETSSDYRPGDILVFLYHNNVFLIHRLLCIEGSGPSAIYLCKGDNAYRLEKVMAQQIVGRATAFLRSDKRYILPKSDVNYLIARLSLLVYYTFQNATGKNLEETKKSSAYLAFQQLLEKTAYDHSI